MFTVHRETHEPSAVRHVLQSRFLDENRVNLVALQANVLVIYNLVRDSAQRNAPCHLEHAISFTLDGMPQHMATVRPKGATRDLLILTFREARVAIVRFQPKMRELETVSLHSFEDEETRLGGWHSNQPLNVRVDPSNRCAALMVYGCKLIVINFVAAGENDASVDVEQSFTSRVIDLQALPQTIGRVDDMVFLDGYDLPCLALLHQPRPAWIGHAAKTKDTAQVTAISLSLDNDSLPPIVWQQHTLPSDSFALIALPATVGGVMVVGLNVVFYATQSLLRSLAINGFSRISTNAPIQEQSGVSVDLDQAHFTLLTPSHILFALPSGDILLLTIVCTDVAVEGLRMDKLATSVISSALCPLGSRHIFVGSRYGNSLLLEWAAVTETGLDRQTTIDGDAPVSEVQGADVYANATTTTTTTTTAAATTTRTRTSIADDDMEDVYGGESIMDTAGGGAGGGGGRVSTIRLMGRDALPTLSPFQSTAVGISPQGAPSHTEQRWQYELLSCVGRDKNGALAHVSYTLKPQILLTEDALSSVRDCWAVHSHGSKHHTHVVLSKPKKTLVFRVEGDFEQLRHPRGFDTQASTVFAGNVLERQLMLQITAKHVLLLDDRDCVFDERMPKGVRIAKATVCDPYIALLLNDSTCKMYQVQKSKSGAFLHPLPNISPNTDLLSLSLYKDTSGMFTRYSREELERNAELRAQTADADSGGGGDDEKEGKEGKENGPQGGSGKQKESSERKADVASGWSTEGKQAADGSRGKKGAEYNDNGDDDDDDDNLYSADVEEPARDAAAKDATTAMAAKAVVDEAPAAMDEAADDDAGAAAEEVPREEGEPTFWLLTCDKRGTLSIFQVPDMKEAFCCTVFSTLPGVAWDSVFREELGSITLEPELPLKRPKMSVTDENPATTTSATSSNVDINKSNSNNVDINDSSSNNDDGSSGSVYRTSLLEDSQDRTGSGGSEVEEQQAEEDEQDRVQRREMAIIELFAIGLGCGAKPYLFVRNEAQHLVAYEFFPSSYKRHTKYEGRLQVRLHKVQHAPTWTDERLGHSSSIPPAAYRPFTDVSGCDGVFVCARRPSWVMCSHQHKIVRYHAMRMDGAVQCFTELKHKTHTNCFLYFTGRGIMRMATTAPGQICTTPLPSRRFPMRASAAFVDFDPESGVYAVVLKHKEPSSWMPKIGPAMEELEAPIIRYAADEPPPHRERFTIRLFSPEDWRLVPNDPVEVLPGHHITAFKVVNINSDQHLSGKRPYVAVGTTPIHGERCFERGRIEMYNIQEVVPEPGKPTTRSKLKQLLTYEEAGGVTALNTIEGHVIGALGRRDGPKIFVWRVNEDDAKLQPIAFLEGWLCTVSLRVALNYVLIGDYTGRVQLARLTKDESVKMLKTSKGTASTVLLNIGRDVMPTSAYAVEFLARGDQLHMVYIDKNANVVILTHDADDPSTRGGRLLKRHSVFNLGHQRVVSLTRIRNVVARSGRKTGPASHFLAYQTLEGAAGYITPVAEDIYRRLKLLQFRLLPQLNFRAGLHPSEFRKYKMEKPVPVKNEVRTICADIYTRLFMLDLDTQKEVARQVGTTTKQLFDDFLRIEDTVAWF